MAPKRRKDNFHLPPRVYHKHGAFYYVKNNKWMPLGKTFSEAMEKWSKIVDKSISAKSMNQLFDRYMLEIAPLKAPSSYKKNIYQMKELRDAFGDMNPEDISPTHIYRYLDLRGKKAAVSANREKSLLSHVFSLAIRWGIVRDNPCRHVKRITERPRQRYIEDWEYLEVRKVCSPTLQLLMDFAYLTGQRIGDIIQIKLSDISEGGIKIEQNKTGTRILINWSDALIKCVEEIKKLPKSKIHSFTLFVNTKGFPIHYDSFSTLWQKAMKKALANGLLKETFTFHDIRAKSASDATNKQEASALLGHTDIKITERIYNRKINQVRPIK